MRRNYNTFKISDKKELLKLLKFISSELDINFEEKGRILYSILENLDDDDERE